MMLFPSSPNTTSHCQRQNTSTRFFTASDFAVCTWLIHACINRRLAQKSIYNFFSIPLRFRVCPRCITYSLHARAIVAAQCAHPTHRSFIPFVRFLAGPRLSSAYNKLECFPGDRRSQIFPVYFSKNEIAHNEEISFSTLRTHLDYTSRFAMATISWHCTWTNTHTHTLAYAHHPVLLITAIFFFCVCLAGSCI